jgi:hypothetical protein
MRLERRFHRIDYGGSTHAPRGVDVPDNPRRRIARRTKRVSICHARTD